jgi:spore germination protein YaaH
MRKATLPVIPLLFLLAFSWTSAAQQPLQRLFYVVDSESSYNALVEHIDQISIVAPVAYNVDEDGVVWGGVDPRVLELAKNHGVPVMPLIHNPKFNQEMLTGLLTSDAARGRAIETLVSECRRHGYLGIQFDFENLHINDRDHFTRFYRETASALHDAGYQLSIAVVHRPGEYPGPTKYFKWLYKNWRAGYDLKALADAGDFISVMTYSQHTRRTPPGPNAGIPWVNDNVAYFLKYVPASKLSLGIPVVSQHWTTEQDDDLYLVNARSWSKSLKHREALALADRFGAEVRWLEDQGVPYTFFENGGLFEWIFLEDVRSFARKLEVVRKNGLRGFSVWVLGHEDPAIWDDLGPTSDRRD